MNESVYQHYRQEERVFIDQVYNWIIQVENYYAPYLSHFLTPRESMIVTQLVGNREDVKLRLFGGYDGAERVRALLFPSYYDVTKADFDFAAINIVFPMKFAQITHGRILGTLISTGLDRSRIGDIITNGVDWHIIVDNTMKHYAITNVTKIANVGVRLEEIALVDLLHPVEEWESKTIISSSLRLDTLVSNVYNFSRQRAKDAVDSGIVKVNFVPMERSDFIVGEQDIVSVRQYGRFSIDEIEGFTKKDHYRLKVKILSK